MALERYDSKINLLIKWLKMRTFLSMSKRFERHSLLYKLLGSGISACFSANKILQNMFERYICCLKPGVYLYLPQRCCIAN